MELTVEQIMDYQTLLKERGYYTGEIDGIIGPLTRAAAEAMMNSDKPTDIDAIRGDKAIKPLGKALDAITQTTGLVYGTDVNADDTEEKEEEEEEPTMYWGRYDSGSWFTSTLDGIEDDGTWKWAWKIKEFEGKSKEDFTSDKTLEEVLAEVTDPAVNPPDDGEGSGEGDVSTGFQGTQLWELDGATYVVFPVPGTDLYLRYLADDETLDLYYSSGREKPDVISKSADDEEWVNSSFFGDLAEVDKDIIEGDKEPFVGLADKFDVAKKYRPWLEDDELYNIWLEAFIEDRDILDEE